MVLWRPQDLLELTPPKDVLFIIGDWNAKVGSQEIPGVTGKFGLEVQNEARQRLIEFCQENALVIANTLFQQQEKTLPMDITRWSTLKSEWLYSLQPKMEKLYPVWKKKKRPGADYGSYHKPLITKFRFKLKKVWKITRPFRYDLIQVPYDYRAAMTDSFKVLDLIVSLKNYGWRVITLYRRWWPKPSPRKRNATRQNSHLKRPYK